jgi:four helix bundle protein
MKNYKKLKVWEEAMDLVERLYVWSRQLPKEEIYGLTSQIRRAAVSVPANIAEGSASKTDKGLNRYLTISLGSAFELETHLIIVEKLYPEVEGTEQLIEQIKLVQMKLVAFKRRLE